MCKNLLVAEHSVAVLFVVVGMDRRHGRGDWRAWLIVVGGLEEQRVGARVGWAPNVNSRCRICETKNATAGVVSCGKTRPGTGV